MRSIQNMILAGSAMVMALGAAAVQAQDEDTTTPWVKVLEEAPDSAWRTLDPENTLYMDLPSGRIIIEMRPDFAPRHVERIKTLSREGFYDGTIFHRVIEGFMAQGGDPTGTGTGGSNLGDLQQEFLRERGNVENFTLIGHDRRNSEIGFSGPIPVATQPESLRDFLAGSGLAAWGMHCRGVMSMARAGDPNSANSQFFLMFADSRRALDQRYTVWGRVVDGFENARRINRGEPPERPTPINKMRIAADVPASDRVDVQVLRTDSEAFESFLREGRALNDENFINDVCSINIPTKINGEIEF